MKKIQIVIKGLVIGCMFLLSCKKEDIGDIKNISPSPTLIVTNKGEQMPVWVEGKGDSGYILLAVHGGPGSDVLDFRNYQGGTGFKEIEKKILVAYWQQRSSGQSVGAQNKAYYTVEQYVEDCDKVIDELRNKYPNKKIVLLGHSWGGMLTAAYLSDPSRQTKIAAWIDAAGAHNGTILLKSTQTDLQEEASVRISKNENVSYWEEVKTKSKDEASANAIAYAVLDKIGEVAIKVNHDDFKFTKKATTSNETLFPEIIKRDYTNSLATNFEKPVLFLWGKYDFAVSKKLRDNLMPKLSKNKVTNVNFDASGHYMMFHEPSKFATSILNFVDSL